MSNKVVLQRGFCVKSPPRAKDRWHKRLCTLTLEPITNVECFIKKYHKEYNKESISEMNEVSQYLIFSYYKDEGDELKDRALKKFILENFSITDYPTGAKSYTYVLKLHLGRLYNDREMFLCFDHKNEHQNWLQAFSTKMNLARSDSMESKLDIPVQKFHAVTDSSLQKELSRRRSLMHEEREEKARLSMISSSFDEEYDAYKSQEAPHKNENTRTLQRGSKAKEVKSFRVSSSASSCSWSSSGGGESETSDECHQHVSAKTPCRISHDDKRWPSDNT